jgi:1,4-dihydroxy-2-naphthoate octaprenyltransferase
MSAVIAFSLFVFFAVTYSIPKIRIRNKPLLGFLWNPFLALSIFSGVFLIYSKVNYEFLIIAVGISLFYFFSEILHQLDHYEIDKEDGRRTLVTLWGKEYTRGLAKKLSWLIIPLGVFWGILFFLEVQWGILFSIIFFINSWRVLKLMNIKPNNKIKKVRSSFGGKIEMILYIIYFLMKPFIL